MRKLLVCGLCFALLLAACSSNDEPISVEARQIAALETRSAALEAQIAALEAQIVALPTPAAGEHLEDTTGAAFEVAVAQYVMDIAGFHALDEGLNETKTVDPVYLSTVNRVRKVVAQAPWPEELHGQAGAFVDVLTEFAAALEADNGEEAAALAAEAHAAQHEFSVAIDAWLGTSEGEHDHGG